MILLLLRRGQGGVLHQGFDDVDERLVDAHQVLVGWLKGWLEEFVEDCQRVTAFRTSTPRLGSSMDNPAVGDFNVNLLE